MISAKQVKELREMTGAGMMDCKEALTETDGDIEAAKDYLRKKGMKLADKKAGRDTNHGVMAVNIEHDDFGYEVKIMSVKCETDFVAKNEKFVDFVQEALISGKDVPNIDTTEIVSVLGENIKVEHVRTFLSAVNAKTIPGIYIHNKVADNVGQIVSFVCIDDNGSEELADQIAKHIAAMSPKAIDMNDLDEDFINHERQILKDQVADSNKPAEIIEKMIEGRLKKNLSEILLLDQKFVFDTNKTVRDILKENNTEVLHFYREEVGQ